MREPDFWSQNHSFLTGFLILFGIASTAIESVIWRWFYFVWLRWIMFSLCLYLSLRDRGQWTLVLSGKWGWLQYWVTIMYLRWAGRQIFIFILTFTFLFVFTFILIFMLILSGCYLCVFWVYRRTRWFIGRLDDIGWRIRCFERFFVYVLGTFSYLLVFTSNFEWQLIFINRLILIR